MEEKENSLCISEVGGEGIVPCSHPLERRIWSVWY